MASNVQKQIQAKTEEEKEEEEMNKKKKKKRGDPLFRKSYFVTYLRLRYTKHTSSRKVQRTKRRRTTSIKSEFFFHAQKRINWERFWFSKNRDFGTGEVIGSG